MFNDQISDSSLQNIDWPIWLMKWRRSNSVRATRQGEAPSPRRLVTKIGWNSRGLWRLCCFLTVPVFCLPSVYFATVILCNTGGDPPSKLGANWIKIEQGVYSLRRKSCHQGSRQKRYVFWQSTGQWQRSQMESEHWFQHTIQASHSLNSTWKQQKTVGRWRIWTPSANLIKACNWRMHHPGLLSVRRSSRGPDTPPDRHFQWHTPRALRTPWRMRCPGADTPQTRGNV